MKRKVVCYARLTFTGHRNTVTTFIKNFFFSKNFCRHHFSLIAFFLLIGCGGGEDEYKSSAKVGNLAPGSEQSIETDTTPKIKSDSDSITLKTISQKNAIQNPRPSFADAQRLADQATFGATERLIAEIQAEGLAGWISSQTKVKVSKYTSGGGEQVHTYQSSTDEFCRVSSNAGPNCWRDNFSTAPLLWDFYRNAVSNPDQLRQRMAFALQQIFVISGREVEGTYGFRNYYNNLMSNSLGNFRDVLKTVALSPLMGDYLNNVNNDKISPNENFARELMQIFTIGVCEENQDGSLKDGRCVPTFDNELVKSYALALSGWTYPPGGKTSWGCWPQGTACRFYIGNMVPVASRHDNTSEHRLLGGLTVPAGASAEAALNKVVDSLMGHPNLPPRFARRIINHFVLSNPTPAYIKRVSAAFSSGKYYSGSYTFGAGQNGDLLATLAATLLDPEARATVASGNSGKLREPALLFTGVLRAMEGYTDGEPLGETWGNNLRQVVFRPPSVFNFYPEDYPVSGTDLIGPSFALLNADSSLMRLNYLQFLFDRDGAGLQSDISGAIGTRIRTQSFLKDASDPVKLVDRISSIALGQSLSPSVRSKVVEAVSWFDPNTDSKGWQEHRVRAAAYLVFASPAYQVQR